ncbi:MAG: membrane protein insertion efficiency factor YidD [Deltaproteobacteria bacterium]|jgi:putative membrane protein insertion efficiency factor|nr:membrane protein insertion efficiency factor YidD [Deltaproteobacteria bacterium]MBW2496253.1 membrane protein insertion efficiency factor YidD [Deltaproteobacteria bacterium]
MSQILLPQAPSPAGPIGRAAASIFRQVFQLYRVLISPLFGQTCRFEPSCSHFAEESFLRHGPIRGLSLTVARLLRCHPFHPGGYDPVP